MKFIYTRASFIRDLKLTAWALLLCVASGFQARQHWLPDLMIHFAFQYFVGALVLSILLAFFRCRRFCLLTVLIAVFSFTQMWRGTDYVRANPAAKPALTVVQYNTFIHNKDRDAIKRWLLANGDKFDIVVLQEAGYDLARMTDDLLPAYPYRISEPRKNAFGMVLLSRYRFLAQEKISIEGPIYTNFALRVLIQPPGMTKPFALYALHAVPPIGGAYQAQRNAELKAVAQRIGNDRTPHILLEGDWNITPYSPYYKDLRKTTGLEEQRTTPLPLPTWPSHGFPWLLQIPIDHILADSSLRLLTLKRGPGLGSDHMPIIATFRER